ncbi:hypothetical protein B9Z51_05185 [Limnohabitans sp. T6-5]|nr:hypothetical protein B9Z51_05185 [Limnohabitans sp. T6-5]
MLDHHARGAAWSQLQNKGARWLRRWAWGLGSALLGACAVVWGHSDVTDAYAQADQALKGTRQQLAALPPPAPLKAQDAELEQRDVLARLPGQAQSGRIWQDLQQTLSQHGLRVLALRPLVSELPRKLPGRAAPLADKVSPVPSQAVALRLIAPFERWVQAWAAFADAGPVWSVDNLSIVALPEASEVQIDAVLRVWMRPGDSTWQSWPGQDASSGQAKQVLRQAPAVQASQLFAPPGSAALPVTPAGLTRVPANAAQPEPDSLSDDPTHWPLARLRLAGVWQQGADRHAVLVAGPHWARVQAGQRVTQEGHRVVTITSEGVTLRPAHGPVHVLQWQGGR